VLVERAGRDDMMQERESYPVRVIPNIRTGNKISLGSF